MQQLQRWRVSRSWEKQRFGKEKWQDRAHCCCNWLREKVQDPAGEVVEERKVEGRSASSEGYVPVL